MLAQQLRGDHHDFVRRRKVVDLARQPVEQAKALGADLQCPFRRDPGGGLDDDGEPPGRPAVIAQDRRIIEVHYDDFRCAAAIEGHLLVAEGQSFARQAYAHHQVVEIGDLGPSCSGCFAPAKVE